MSNRHDAVGEVSVLPNFAITGEASAMVFEARARTEKAMDLAGEFASLFRGIGRFLSRLDKTIANARSMRDLVNLNNRTLRDIGIHRSDIPTIIARGEFDHGVETAIRKYLDSAPTDRTAT